MSEKRIFTDEDGGKREPEERVEIVPGEVPLYRSYGVTKRYRPGIAKFNNMLSKLMVAALIALEVVNLVIIGFCFWIYSGELIATIVTVLLGTLVYRTNTRIPRARHKFTKKLKKFCRQNGFTLEFKRGFWSSLSWADKGQIDFLLKTAEKSFYVRYATATKKLSTMSFLSPTEIKYTKHPRNNKFTLIFDFKDKEKIMRISFPDHIDESDKSIVKAILINPVPMNIEKKGPPGMGMEPTGTGERIFGYTIYNATGFIETLKRIAEEESRKTKR